MKELHIREIDIRLKELDFVESAIEELDRQIKSIVASDHRAKLLDLIPCYLHTQHLFLMI